MKDVGDATTQQSDASATLGRRKRNDGCDEPRKSYLMSLLGTLDLQNSSCDDDQAVAVRWIRGDDGPATVGARSPPRALSHHNHVQRLVTEKV